MANKSAKKALEQFKMQAANELAVSRCNKHFSSLF